MRNANGEFMNTFFFVWKDSITFSEQTMLFHTKFGCILNGPDILLCLNIFQPAPNLVQIFPNAEPSKVRAVRKSREKSGFGNLEVRMSSIYLKSQDNVHQG